MFAQALIYVFIVMTFAWLLWKWIVIPILKDMDIDYKEQRTEYTKKLERLKEEYDEMTASAQAAEQGVEIMEKIKEMEDKIVEADRKMNEMD